MAGPNNNLLFLASGAVSIVGPSMYEARDAVIAETAFGTDTHGLAHCQHVTP